MSIIHGISIVCFASSYMVSLVLELTRFFFQATIRNVVMIGFAAAGLVAHSLFLVAEAQRGLTLTSWYHGALVVAWIFAAVYLAITLWPRRSSLGILVLPTIVGLVLLAQVFPRESNWTPDQAGRVWALIHAGALLIGTTSALVGFFAGVLYLAESRRLKQKKLWPYWVRLPSLEWLQHVNEASLIVSCCSLVAGLVFGVLANVSRSSGARIAWSDPVIWMSGILLVWLIAALVFNAIYRPARRGRKVAYLTVASFIFLSLVLGMLVWGPSEHSGPAPAAPRPPSPPAADQWELRAGRSNPPLAASWQHAGSAARPVAWTFSEVDPRGGVPLRGLGAAPMGGVSPSPHARAAAIDAPSNGRPELHYRV